MKTKMLWIPALALAWSATDLMAATPAAGTTPAAAKTAATAAPSGAAVRNWADVDKNGDNAVTPEEMEAYLKANPGPQRPRN